MGDDERALLPRIRYEEVLEVLVPEEVHRVGEALLEKPGKGGGKTPHVAVRDVGGKQLPGLRRHFLVDPAEAFDEAAGVVLPVLALPDRLDDLLDGAGFLLRRLGGDPAPTRWAIRATRLPGRHGSDYFVNPSP